MENMKNARNTNVIKNRIKSVVEPQISIIIPHFNSSNYIEKLLASIPKVPEIQTIVIDDKSSDSHVDMVRSLQSQYAFEFYHNDRTKSAGTCRNIGLEHASGRWVLFADSDDYFLDGFYENVSRYFESQADVIYFMPTSIYSDTGEIADRHIDFQEISKAYMNNRDKNNDIKLRYSLHIPTCKLMRRSFIEKHHIRFDEVLASNDVMFSVKSGHYMKTFEIDDSEIYCLTRNRGSLTTNLSEEILDARLETQVRFFDFLKKHLSKDEIAVLEPKSLRLLIRAFRDHGLTKFIKTLNLYQRNHIKWFYLSYLKPSRLVSRVIGNLIGYRRMQRFTVK